MHVARLLLVLVVVGTVWKPAEVNAQANAATIERTAQFAGQSGWSGNSPPTSAPTYDRYGQAINSSAATLSQQAQGAFSSAGNTLRDGVEAGIRAAEQTFGTVGGQSPTLTTNPAITAGNARGGVSSPWPTTGSAPAAAPSWSSNTPISGAQNARSVGSVPTSASSWSSIGNSVAAPPLLIPQSPMATSNLGGAGTASAAMNRNGPNFPAAPTAEPPQLHSVLSDPSRTAASPPASTPATDWISGWNNNATATAATIGRNGGQPTLGGTVRESGLEPLPGSTAATSDSRVTSSARPNDNWPESWNQPLQGAPAATIGSQNKPAANSGQGGTQFGNPAAGPAANVPNGQFAAPATNPFAGQPNSPAPGAQPAGNYNMAGMNPNGTMMNNGQWNNSQLSAGMNVTGRNQVGIGGAEQPWVPLVLSVLGLAASFAANLYLGASYLDARQKYQSLVRKTADTFRRVSAAAA